MEALATIDVAPADSEPMAWSEICARYPDQWVGLGDLVMNPERPYEVRTARVLSHGVDRRDVLRELRPARARYEDARHLFTGRIRAPFPRFL